MSTFSTPIVAIPKFSSHPNADTLSICQILNYPVIFKTGDFYENEKAIFLYEESLVPNEPQYEFMWSNRIKDGKEIRETDRVVKAKKLRNIFSCGILIPLPPQYKHLPVGADLSKELGIEKYEKPEKVNIGGDNRAGPSWFVKYTEIENIRKYPILQQDEIVVCTEKTHGSNARFCIYEDELWIGSHNNCKKDDGINVWSRVAQRLNLKERLCPGYIYFGEIYGPVQKGFGYDSPKQADLVLFDIYSLLKRRYLDYEDFLRLAKETGLKVAPLIYLGPWLGLDKMVKYADGPTILGNSLHIREGFVVKPVVERWNQEVGRVILKCVGEEYLLKKYQ